MKDEAVEPTDGGQQLPRVFGIEAIDLSLQLHDLLGLDGDVRGLTLITQGAAVIITSTLK